MRQAWAPRHPQNDNMANGRIEPYQPPHPTIREQMESTATRTVDAGIPPNGEPG